MKKIPERFMSECKVCGGWGLQDLGDAGPVDCYVCKGAGKVPFACLVCGKPAPDRYMVLPSVWTEAFGAGAKGFCHLPCLEVHLGRELSLKDFTAALINNPIRWAYRRGKTKK